MDRNFAIFPPRVWPLPQSGTAYAPVGCQLPRRCNFVSRVILRLAWYRGTRSFRLIKSFIIRCVPSHISFPCESETNQCAFFMNMLPTWCTLPPTVKRRQIDNLSSEYVGVFPPFFVPCTITDISVDLTSFRHDRGGEWSLKSSSRTLPLFRSLRIVPVRGFFHGIKFYFQVATFKNTRTISLFSPRGEPFLSNFFLSN